MTDYLQLRIQIREARRQVPKKYARQASLKFSERIAQLDSYRKAKRIAGFLPFDGEADPLPLMERAILEKKEVYVPTIVAKDKPLLFAPWNRATQLKKNQFGILEPSVRQEQLVEAKELECVVTPLVAFDEDLNRLGVGGGYYDRSFAFLNEKTRAETSR